MTERALGRNGLSIRPFVLGGNVFGMTAPIASATSVVQLDEILGSEDVVLTGEQLAELSATGG